MTTEQKGEVIEVLKGKFSQYNNFYITNTESLTVEQVNKLRRLCFEKNVEMTVAKNTLIRKAMEQLDAERFNGSFDSLHGVTALMFSDSAKEPALIISSFRKDAKSEKPVLKAAFINGDMFVGDNQLAALTQIKSKNELIGEVIGLLQSPAKRVIAALLHHHENGGQVAAEATATPESSAPEASAPEAPADEAPATDAPAAE
ncbi:MAG: 50S ribosomal protein L10 [Taibaiella sp.]|nr:50S ribosomal protein L10 [Taibaiella sp.]